MYFCSICKNDIEEEMPAVLAGAMGDFAYMARFETEEQAIAFAHFVMEK